MAEPPAAAPPPDDGSEPVPVFGTWPRIYGAVIAVLLAVMAAIALFSYWPY